MKKIEIRENIEIKYSQISINYLDALNFMENRVSEILQNKNKELIWFLNHNHIYTIGKSGNQNEVLKKTNVPIIETNRGGKITYHGPGQRIVYFVINLNKRKKDIRQFVNIIELSAIKVLKKLDIDATTYSDRVGIWINKPKNKEIEKEKKIGAIGLRIRKWVAYHGLSFNISPDLIYYQNINACGLSNYSATSIKSLGMNLTQNEFDRLYLKYFLKELKNFK